MTDDGEGSVLRPLDVGCVVAIVTANDAVRVRCQPTHDEQAGGEAEGGKLPSVER